ncbi:EAL domain-containing protein [Vibrio tritonius]|uniref:EAL domain-containing protein n=1 Tax=Vibrio tritonius TaxID=1435069 RepID=A0ABS7YQN1_9VIBR|nr:GGDEF domain-containing phosphodiesterase [Vibrio tritonius]MCA2017287.1 EAL domain-containing protein [Vibrio tritonius]
MYKTERLKVFSANLPFLVSVNIGISTILVISGIYDGISTDKLFWMLSIYAVSALRLFFHYGISSTNPHKLDFHFFGVVLAGVVWASYPYLFHQNFTIKQEMVALIIFCGMSGGSASLLSADLRSSIAFTTITVIPFCLVLMGMGPDEKAIGIMGIGYAIALCLSAVRSSTFIINSIRSQLHVESLVANLESEVEKRTAKILTLEQRDMLTGLYNRTSFTTKVEMVQDQAFEQPNNIETFIHINLEAFHIINDNYGHEFGDLVLTLIGKRLTNIDKYYGSVSARWGNDEFIIYLSTQSTYTVNEYIDLVREKLSEPIQHNNIRVSLTFHIGYFDGSEPMPILRAIKNAQLAMNDGKKNHIRVRAFDQDIQDQYERKEYLRLEMLKAIENQTFFMNYQPIVDIKTQRIHSFEALVRWKVAGEPIAPDEFIAIAEENGLITDLGKLIMKMSLMALNRVNQRHPQVAISINVSAIEFEHDEFIDYLDFLIHQYSIITQNIHLEITETAMISNLARLSNVIKRLKNKGIMISVDDFGTGFSSISVLKNLSVDFIKIDKTYVDDICSNEKDQSIVSAVTKMAHTINSKVIAEGVELPEQLAILRSSDVDFIQGYLFSKPVSFETMLTQLAYE